MTWVVSAWFILFFYLTCNSQQEFHIWPCVRVCVLSKVDAFLVNEYNGLFMKQRWFSCSSCCTNPVFFHLGSQWEALQGTEVEAIQRMSVCESERCELATSLRLQQLHTDHTVFMTPNLRQIAVTHNDILSTYLSFIPQTLCTFHSMHTMDFPN